MTYRVVVTTNVKDVNGNPLSTAFESVFSTGDTIGIFTDDIYSPGEYLCSSGSTNTSSASVSITGTTSSNTITGTSGNDVIDSKGGSDNIEGGEGSDTVIIFANCSNFTITTLAGVTKVVGDSSAGAYAYDTITLANVEKIIFADRSINLITSPYSIIYGTGNGQTLTGTNGNDYFDSDGGSDNIDGEAGNDTLLIFATRSHFTITTLAGVTKVVGDSSAGAYAYDTITLANVETIQFSDQTVALDTTSYNIIYGTGNGQTLTGTNGNDYFDSDGGDDDIDGGKGTDTLLIFDNSSNFTITTIAGITRIEGSSSAASAYRYNTINVTNVEEILFIDKSISITTFSSGAEILVNTSINNDQNEPRVAVLSDDTFVVVWKSQHTTSKPDIFAQHFDREGQKIQDEFKVNNCTVSAQQNPDISALEPDQNSTHGFVITWNGPKDCSEVSSGGNENYAQVYDMNRNIINDDFGVDLDFTVDQTLDSSQRFNPKVTNLKYIAGGFVITYIQSPIARLRHQSFDESVGFIQATDMEIATAEGDKGEIDLGDITSLGGSSDEYTMTVVIDNNDVKGYATTTDGTPLGWTAINYTRDNYASNPSVTSLDSSNYLVSFTIKAGPNSDRSMGHILHCYTTYCNGENMESVANFTGSINNSYLFYDLEESGTVDNVRTAKLTNNRFVSVFDSNKNSIATDDIRSIFSMIWTYSTAADLTGPNSSLNEYANSRGTPFKVNDTVPNSKFRPDVDSFSDGGYVVVWTESGGDGSSDAVKMKIFD
jgi:Ca2+-binding RTX toxin-like protein